MSVYETRLYTLRLPYYMKKEDMPGYDDVQEILRRALDTYREFGHVNYDVPEGEEDIVNAWLNTTNYCGVSVYRHEPSKVYEAWDDSIDSLCCNIKTYEEAERLLPVVKKLVYDYERDMGTPIDGVNQSIIEDSDGTFKIINKPKYYTF